MLVDQESSEESYHRYNKFGGNQTIKEKTMEETINITGKSFIKKW